MQVEYVVHTEEYVHKPSAREYQQPMKLPIRYLLVYYARTHKYCGMLRGAAVAYDVQLYSTEPLLVTSEFKCVGSEAFFQKCRQKKARMTVVKPNQELEKS